MSQQPEREGVRLSLISKSEIEASGSAEESPRFTKIEITADESSTQEDCKGTPELHKNYQQLFLAAQNGDWEGAKSFIDNDPSVLTATVNPYKETLLHIAARSCQWGFLLDLLKLHESPESIAMRDQFGKTVLHYVAQGQSLKSAKALVEKNPDLPQMADGKRNLPLLFSTRSEKKEMVRYLSLITRFDPHGPSLLPILRSLIRSGFHGELKIRANTTFNRYNLKINYLSGTNFNRCSSIINLFRVLTSIDIALYLVGRYPESALAKNNYGTLLWWLASTPSHFKSGSNRGFLERWMYKLVNVEQQINHLTTDSATIDMEGCLESMKCPQVLLWFKRLPCNPTAKLELLWFKRLPCNPITKFVLPWFKRLPCNSTTKLVLLWFKRLPWNPITKLASSIKMVRDAKLKHECASQLVKLVCKELSTLSFKELDEFLTNSKPFIDEAVKGGIEEFVNSLFEHLPAIINYQNTQEKERKTLKGNIVQAAIKFRQEKIYNIIKNITPISTKNMCSFPVQESGLYLAAQLAPSSKLYSVSGAAFQMQRELQWFKEVEKITFIDQRESIIKKKETAKDVFRSAHKDLAKQGEEWMKGTANSCMLVSTLIATVLFAAVFTVPGGNVNDKGIPIFLHRDAFVVFAISEGLGLFSSLTSLLMFLAILTARYKVDDFLESLPRKLIIGLGSLFFAIAAMIAAFGAALHIILKERWLWIYLPITFLACVPLLLFVMLQLPLFIQMIRSTFGSSIFSPWPSRYFE